MSLSINFYWKDSSLNHVPIDAQVIGEYLLKLETENGGRPLRELIDEKFHDEASPLQKWFEWDDDVAAKKYRVWQFVQLMSNLDFNAKET